MNFFINFFITGFFRFITVSAWHDKEFGGFISRRELGGYDGRASFFGIPRAFFFLSFSLSGILFSLFPLTLFLKLAKKTPVGPLIEQRKIRRRNDECCKISHMHIANFGYSTPLLEPTKRPEVVKGKNYFKPPTLFTLPSVYCSDISKAYRQ